MRFPRFGLFLALAAMTLAAVPAVRAAGPKAVVQKNCLNCHASFGKMEGVLAGNLSAAVFKANTIQLQVGPKRYTLNITKDTTAENVPNLKDIKPGMAMRIHYHEDGGRLAADRVVVKPKFDVPEDQLIDVGQLAKLVAQGPSKGKYTLVDSRPPGGFAGGHIPTAINIPFPAMKKMAKKLPRDKNQLLVFYCQGFR